MIDFAKQEGIPVSATKRKPYSTDENMFHISYESGILVRRKFQSYGFFIMGSFCFILKGGSLERASRWHFHHDGGSSQSSRYAGKHYDRVWSGSCREGDQWHGRNRQIESFGCLFVFERSRVKKRNRSTGFGGKPICRNQEPWCVRNSRRNDSPKRAHWFGRPHARSRSASHQRSDCAQVFRLGLRKKSLLFFCMWSR